MIITTGKDIMVSYDTVVIMIEHVMCVVHFVLLVVLTLCILYLQTMTTTRKRTMILNLIFFVSDIYHYNLWIDSINGYSNEHCSLPFTWMLSDDDVAIFADDDGAVDISRTKKQVRSSSPSMHHKRNAPLPRPRTTDKSSSHIRSNGPSSGQQRSSTSSKPEDNFHTNTPVDGVDPADKVKSDGKFVYAAYGDVLYVWNATDATQGVSITAMLGNATDCHWNETEAEPCNYVSKPKIQALLLSGGRLTAIVDQFSYVYPLPENYTSPIISDSTKLSVQVYDVSNVKLGTPLKMLAHEELNGSFFDGHSVDDKALIISQVLVDFYQFTEDLYRYDSQYCGLSSSEYTARAAEVAASKVEAFAKQLVDELKLINNGCSNIFQVSMMQGSSNGTNGNSSMPDLTGGNLISGFTQVTTFDMASDFGSDGSISLSVAGAFNEGWISVTSVGDGFIATVTDGYTYDYSTEKSYYNTYLLGFDTTGATAEPFCYGSVPGWLSNKFSLDLWDGHLRVATTAYDDWTSNSTTSNKIFVLRIPENGSFMETVGETEHLGEDNDSIYAVRFIEERAYVVTYGAVDPFIIVDLSDHTEPKTVGELEIPGHSSYLQKLEVDGEHFILGIGSQITNETTWESSLKLTLFDVKDPSSPRVAAEHLAANLSTDAEYDFQAIRYLTESKKLVIPFSSYVDGISTDGFMVFDVASDEIELAYDITLPSETDYCWYEASVPPRMLVVQSKLTTVKGHSVVNADLSTGSVVWELDLDVGFNYSVCEIYEYDYDEYYYNQSWGTYSPTYVPTRPPVSDDDGAL